MSQTNTHSDCITTYSHYWGKMLCITHNTPYTQTTVNPTHRPAGAFRRLLAILSGSKK